MSLVLHLRSIPCPALLPPPPPRPRPRPLPHLPHARKVALRLLAQLSRDLLRVVVAVLHPQRRDDRSARARPSARPLPHQVRAQG
eukprot:96896-Hanusia_phi.AAC.1